MRSLPLRTLHGQAGATFTEFQGWEVVEAYERASVRAYERARTGSALVDLSCLGCVWLRGRDAQDYLHRRLTNSVKNRAVGEGCKAALLTAGGRLIAEFGLHRTREHEFLVIAPPACAEGLSAEFDKFIFTEDCQVAAAPEGSSVLGVFGPHAGTLVRSYARTLPEAMPLWGCGQGAFGGREIVVVQSALMGEPGFFLLSPSPLAGEGDGGWGDLWRALVAAGATPMGLEALEALRIKAGVPLFGRDHDARWLPTDAGIEEAVIDYEKGCFPGQEVVAKIRNLSHPREVLCGFVLPAAQPPPAGIGVFHEEQQVGTLTSLCADSATGRVLALGHLKWKWSAAGQTLRVGPGAEHGTALVVELPFAT